MPLINEINGSNLFYNLTFHVKRRGKRDHVNTAHYGIIMYRLARWGLQQAPRCEPLPCDQFKEMVEHLLTDFLFLNHLGKVLSWILSTVHPLSLQGVTSCIGSNMPSTSQHFREKRHHFGDHHDTVDLEAS